MSFASGPATACQPPPIARRRASACLAGALSVAVPLFIYLATLAPTVSLEDSGEFITGAHVLGVLHPPGFPTWCLLAHGAALVPLGTVAQRVNAFSAVAGALTCGVVYLIARQLGCRPWTACTAALLLAVSQIFWSQAVIAEVYTLHTLAAAAATSTVLAWRASRRAEWLCCLAGLVGLGLGCHILMGLIAPVLAGWVLWIDARAALKPKTLAVAALVLLAGLSVHLYLPWRARAAPPLNWGNPRTLEATWAHVRREVYQSDAARRGGTPRDLVRHLAAAGVGIARSFTPFALPLAAVGAVWLVRRRPDAVVAGLALAAGNVIVLNLLIRAPHSPIWEFAHRVYYLPTHLLVAVALGCGLEALAGTARRAGLEGPAAPSLKRAPSWLCVAARGRVWLAGAAGLGLLAANLALHAASASRRGDTRARQYALDVLSSLPQGAGVVPADDVLTFPLLYLKYVEGLRSDVQLLKPDFGWDGRAVSAVYSSARMSPGLAAAFPMLAGRESIPHGLGYLLVEPAEAAAWTEADFAPLRSGPGDIGPRPPAFDPFDVAIRSAQAVYYARLGARQAARGEPAEAVQSFDRAEQLACDPHELYLLAESYRRLGWREERIVPHLRRALALADAHYDRQAERLAAVTSNELRAALDLALAANQATTTPDE